MSKIKLVVFDLSGTTIDDDNAVAKCLFEGAKKYGINASVEDFQLTTGTNKIRLYEYMLARDAGHNVSIEQLEFYSFPQYKTKALEVFQYYSSLMIDFYRSEVKAMAGAEEVFEWCQMNGISVATDTGFHKDVSIAIMEGLKWIDRKLINLSIDVDDTNGIGRPAPYMIYSAMYKLGIKSIHSVIKIGDTPADLLSGYNAGCIGNIGVLSGANKIETLFKYPHSHILNSVVDLPYLVQSSFNRNAISRIFPN